MDEAEGEPDTGKQKSNDPLHGITLERVLTEMVERHGWDTLGQRIRIRCFNFDPSITSSLKFLRKTPWARKKLEDWYVRELGGSTASPGNSA